jgi:hypothetical protein
MVGTLWPYILGGGNHKGPTRVKVGNGYSALGYDCWGFAWSYCYEEPRTVKGFNRGNPKATVVDAINCDSAIEEAEHFGHFFWPVDIAHIGDLLVMPSIRENGKRVRIGHVWIVTGVPAESPTTLAEYETVQCSPPRPAIKLGPGPKSDGRTWRGKTRDEWRIRILRVVQ